MIKNDIEFPNILKTISLKNSTDEIHKHLLREYYLRTMEVEMELYRAKSSRRNDKIQRYFNATPLRNAFCRWMVYAVYANRVYTISELVKDMSSNRQSISEIIKDCEAEGWIDVTRQANLVRCRASATLVESTEAYCIWIRELTKSTIGDAFKAINSFEKLMQTNLAVK